MQNSADLSPVVCRVDPFSKKDWYEVKAPSMFSSRNVGKTLVTRTQGTKVGLETFLKLGLLVYMDVANCVLTGMQYVLKHAGVLRISFEAQYAKHPALLGWRCRLRRTG